jgi:starvation-inducible DNA-binding protein
MATNKSRGTEASNTEGGADFELTTDLGVEAAEEIALELRRLLADVFALYLKTKNFHWHIHGPHFRDYHFLLGEQAEQLFRMTDDIAERGRKIGGQALNSISDTEEMLRAICVDNRELTRFLRGIHNVCQEHNDVATSSLVEVWIDQPERRSWFVSESLRTE